MLKKMFCYLNDLSHLLREHRNEDDDFLCLITFKYER